jgi:hypothetical protein
MVTKVYPVQEIKQLTNNNFIFFPKPLYLVTQIVPKTLVWQAKRQFFLPRIKRKRKPEPIFPIRSAISPSISTAQVRVLNSKETRLS